MYFSLFFFYWFDFFILYGQMSLRFWTKKINNEFMLHKIESLEDLSITFKLVGEIAQFP